MTASNPRSRARSFHPIHLLPLLALALAACSMVPEAGPPTQKLRGKLTFPGVTALPSSATAHVTVMPVLATGNAEPVAQEDFPARTGTEIPFELKFPAEKVAAGEYFVFAQVLDHGKVWYSNLSTPLRVNFTAEPSDVVIELRPEGKP